MRLTCALVQGFFFSSRQGFELQALIFHLLQRSLDPHRHRRPHRGHDLHEKPLHLLQGLRASRISFWADFLSWTVEVEASWKLLGSVEG